MDARLLMLALALLAAGPAFAHKGEDKGKGPKPETVADKCDAEQEKREKWRDKKHRRKERPGHWAGACPEVLPPPPPPPPPGGELPPPPPGGDLPAPPPSLPGM